MNSMLFLFICGVDGVKLLIRQIARKSLKTHAGVPGEWHSSTRNWSDSANFFLKDLLGKERWEKFRPYLTIQFARRGHRNFLRHLLKYDMTLLVIDGLLRKKKQSLQPSILQSSPARCRQAICKSHLLSYIYLENKEIHVVLICHTFKNYCCSLAKYNVMLLIIDNLLQKKS